MNGKRLWGGWALATWACMAFAQPAPPHFKYVTLQNGLNDGYTGAMCQDKYGYIWIATLGGLNRYNGTSIRRFTHQPGDSNGIPEGIAWALGSDSSGRLWAGYDYGLYEYDFSRNGFVKNKHFTKESIRTILAGPKGLLYIRTDNGVFEYDTRQEKATYLNKKLPGLAGQNTSAICFDGKHLLIGGQNGYFTYNPQTRHLSFQPIKTSKSFVANVIFKNTDGHIWLGNKLGFLLYRYSPESQQTDDISLQPEIRNAAGEVSFNDLEEDNEGNTWVVTSNRGLWKFDKKSLQPTIFLKNEQEKIKTPGYLREIFKDHDGNIWISGLEGCVYFNPGNRFFSVVYPMPEGEDLPLARGMIEDSRGNWWFTSGEGISSYNPARQEYRVWRNDARHTSVIYYNSVRGIAEDRAGTIWIATGKGINSFTPGDNKLRFYTIRDSVPEAFYFSANTDSKGRVWFGTRDYEGLYWYDPATRKFSGVKQHPLFKRFAGLGARIVFEDSQKRIWIGFNGSGLGMVDEATGETRYWFNDGTNRNTLAGNNIVDIKEDRQGIIWVSSFSGITGIDPQKDTLYRLDHRNFFKSNLTGPLVVDARNRLWVGTGNGLYLIDSSRSSALLFDESDGLAGASFNEHPGYMLASGEALMPTTRGFIRFDPLKFQTRRNLQQYYIASVESGANKRYLPPDREAKLRLGKEERYFTIGLEAINYANPGQNYYAYKLEGYDKDWRITQEPRASYTNVPGGTYTFRFKAATIPDFGNVPEKTIELFVESAFYTRLWFKGLVVAGLLGFAFWFYRYRLRQARQVHSLENKTQALEKEKAQVMYESLKQQLNPHFLFNSLTSLSGLIETDQKLAGSFLKQMSKIYRYILRNRDSELVTLKDELEFVEVYIQLQKTRFKEGLQVRVQIEPEYLSGKIAPVTLQNLVENAIKHNIIDTETPLCIDIETKDQYVIVRNNLQKKHVVETSNRQGLASLQSLYSYFTSLPLLAEEDENFFTVRIPLI